MRKALKRIECERVNSHNYMCVKELHDIIKNDNSLVPEHRENPFRQIHGFHKLLPTLVFHLRARDVPGILPIQMFCKKPALRFSMSGGSQCGP